MSFWLRYGFLILLCVALPMGLAFWLDTQSQIDRAKAAGEAAASTADPALAAQLTIAAHRRVGEALQIAQAIGDEKLLAAGRAALKPEGVTRMQQLLERDGVQKGFAWVLDETGVVVARQGTTRPIDPERLTGHPLFAATQLGYALDGVLRLGEAVFVVGAAPLTKDGEARGAVFYAAPLDKELVDHLKSAVRADVTMLVSDQVAATTLPDDVVTPLVQGIGPHPLADPIHGGRFATPLAGSGGVLPVFVERDGSGLAYTSVTRAMLGSHGVRWVVSVANAPSLSNLANRQQTMLAVFLAALLAALVIGLSIARTYVRPIGLLSDHLSGLQQGRGEREISEKEVSGPFRRLTKLINMTVQKIPPGGAFAFGESSDRRSSVDPALGDGGPVLSGSNPPPAAVPGSVPPAMTGAAPLNVSSLGSVSGRPSSGAAIARAESGERRPEGSGAFSRVDAPMPSARMESGASPQPAPRSPSMSSRPAAPVVPPPPAPTPMSEPQFAASDLDSALGTGGSLDQALAEAARSVGADPVGPTPSTPPKKTRSASTVRGASSQSMLDVSSSTLQAVGGSTRPGESGSGSRAPVSYGSGGDVAAAPFSGLLDDAKAPASGSQFAMPTTPSGARSGGSAALGFGSAGVPDEEDAHSDDFRSEATVVAATPDYLLQASARDMTASGFAVTGSPEHTVVTEVPKNLLAESKKTGGDFDDPQDMAHFKETYERFVEMRKQCGEPTSDLAFDRFLVKLRKNREGLMSKYSCKTVRFQVYEKDGKAALKATPVR